MKRCKTCGTLYGKALGVCPKCATEEDMQEALRAHAARDPHQEYTQEEYDKLRRRRWIGIVIGVPALIGFIYGILYIISLYHA